MSSSHMVIILGYQYWIYGVFTLITLFNIVQEILVLKLQQREVCFDGLKNCKFSLKPEVEQRKILLIKTAKYLLVWRKAALVLMNK